MNLPPSTTTTTTTTTTSTCSNCGISSRWFIHHVTLRGTERRLCTSCVLRLHPSSFCPSCFEVFDPPFSAAAPHRFLSCVKCSSLTHLSCLPSPQPPRSSFLCPSCSSPNPSSFSFFPIDPSSPRLDKPLCAALLCAAKIANASLARSLSSARAKADRSVREAASARKRARDSIDYLTAVEIAKRAALEGSAEVSGSRNLGIHKVNGNANGVSDTKNNGFRGNNNGAATSDEVKLERVQSSLGR